MSKRQEAADPLLSIDAGSWRRRVRQLKLPMAWPKDAAELIEANGSHVVDDILSRPLAYNVTTLRKTRGKGYSIGSDELVKVLRHLFHAGFVAAVSMHQRELMATGDYIELKQKRRGGGDEGRKISSAKKVTKHQRIRDTHDRLQAEGKPCTYKAVADECECSVSTVERAINRRPTTRRKK